MTGFRCRDSAQHDRSQASVECEFFLTATSSMLAPAVWAQRSPQTPRTPTPRHRHRGGRVLSRMAAQRPTLPSPPAMATPRPLRWDLLRQRTATTGCSSSPEFHSHEATSTATVARYDSRPDNQPLGHDRNVVRGRWNGRSRDHRTVAGQASRKGQTQDVGRAQIHGAVQFVQRIHLIRSHELRREAGDDHCAGVPGWPPPKETTTSSGIAPTRRLEPARSTTQNRTR